MSATICLEISSEIDMFHNLKLFQLNENGREYFQCHQINEYKRINLKADQSLAMLNSVAVYTRM